MLGERPSLVPVVVLVGLTVLTFVASALGTAIALENRENVLARRFLSFALAGFGVAAFVGALAFHFVPLDRYWLPILPLALALTVPGLTARSWSVVATGICVVVMGLISVVGTRDALVVGQASVELANELTPVPIATNELDGGASWMALTFGVPPIDADSFNLEGVPFWVAFFNPGLQPHYALALEPLKGYEVLETREYSSWLHLEPTYLYVLHRDPALPFYLRPEDF
jgi:hypothetical protein